MREIRMLRSTRRGLETWHGRDGVTLADLMMWPVDQPAACGLSAAIGSDGQSDVLVVQCRLEPHNAADLKIAPKEIAREPVSP